MSVEVRTVLNGQLEHLRFERTAKRIRAMIDDQVLVDTTSAVLLWEPRRVVPAYAVPAGEIGAELTRSTPLPVQPGTDAIQGVAVPDVSGREVLDPSIPFDVHTAEGEPVDLTTPGPDPKTLPGTGFRLHDRDLDGYVVLDFNAFTWFEEEELNVAHPKDPFHRIDVLHSSRHLRLELNGELVAESFHPLTLFETNLPVRFYLPVDDIQAELVASPTHTSCAYKGRASYWNVVIGGKTVTDLAWGYPEPLPDAERVLNHVAFFNERLDVTVDGVAQQRPVTPWSRDE